MPIKRVAVIGLGPAGSITIDALAREEAFDQIRVFERREAPGGCWYAFFPFTPPSPISTQRKLILTWIRRLEDTASPADLDPQSFSALADRTAERPLPIPPSLPAKTAKPTQKQYTESSVYPYLETNVDAIPMSFSQEPIPALRSELSVAKHGEDTPFRHHSVIRKYISELVSRRGYEGLVAYNTTVELAEKEGDEWRLVLRRNGGEGRRDEWWEERFDAVVVANGHYHVPYIPRIEGLDAFEAARPGSVKHSKMFRGRDSYRGKVRVYHLRQRMDKH